MSKALDNLIALSLASIGPAMQSPRWEAQMERVIRTAHTAAWLTATMERLGVRDPALLKRPTRAERQDIERAVAAQLKYLRGFAAARGGMSDAAALARARLYAGAIKPFYAQQRWGAWDIPDHLLPGTAQCKGNCLCSISVADNGDGTGVLTRVLGQGAAERHCSDCPPLAGDHPVKRRGATKSITITVNGGGVERTLMELRAGDDGFTVLGSAAAQALGEIVATAGDRSAAAVVDFVGDSIKAAEEYEEATP